MKVYLLVNMISYINRPVDHIPFPPASSAAQENIYAEEGIDLTTYLNSEPQKELGELSLCANTIYFINQIHTLVHKTINFAREIVRHTI